MLIQVFGENIMLSRCNILSQLWKGFGMNNLVNRYDIYYGRLKEDHNIYINFKYNNNNNNNTTDIILYYE